ncbi:MAG TPA: flagellar biosynthetic protein FliO [Solirubrobacteraceae bacterium]|nr:flagellar biosynthetic protein FliO [Solirubrobacteraceae bacterium]
MTETTSADPRAARHFAALATALAAAVLAAPATALAAATHGESTPLDLGDGGSSDLPSASGGGIGVLRAIFGLLLVVALIYGVRWLLHRTQAGGRPRGNSEGLRPLTSLALGSRGTLHLVRAGDEVLLLGQADGQLVSLRRYSEEEAQQRGLLNAPDEPSPDDAAGPSGGGGARGRRTPLGWRAMIEDLRARTVRQ